MYDAGFLSPNDIVLEDLIYIPMSQQVPMFARPYMFNVNGRALDDLMIRLEDTKAGKISTSVLSGLTNDFIQHSSVPLHTPIDQSWTGTKRYIFLLKARVTDAMGIISRNYIFGFTEYDGITRSGNIDPHLNHYVNSIIETAVMQYNTPMGLQQKETLYKFYNVAQNLNYDTFLTQRPRDVLGNYELNNVSEHLSGFDSEIYNIADKRFTYGAYDPRPVCSNIENNISSEYLSKILTAGIQTFSTHDFFMNSHATEYDNDLAGKVPETSLNDNKLLNIFSRLQGMAYPSSVFPFHVLGKLDPSIEGRAMIFNITKNIVDPTMSQTPEVGDYWNGQDPVTLKAYSLIESSVSLAMKFGFSKLFFTASNMATPTGEASVFITNFNSYMDLDEYSFNTLLEMFKDTFLREIFMNETQGNRVPLYVEMYVDMLGTSKIMVDYANMGANWYTIPTFANSMFSPIVTIDKNYLDGLSTGLIGVTNNLVANRQMLSKNAAF